MLDRQDTGDHLYSSRETKNDLPTDGTENNTQDADQPYTTDQDVDTDLPRRGSNMQKWKTHQRKRGTSVLRARRSSDTIIRYSLEQNDDIQNEDDESGEGDEGEEGEEEMNSVSSWKPKNQKKESIGIIRSQDSTSNTSTPRRSRSNSDYFGKRNSSIDNALKSTLLVLSKGKFEIIVQIIFHLFNSFFICLLLKSQLSKTKPKIKISLTLF